MAMVSLEVLIQSFEKLWPKASAQEWDSPGLSLGSPSQQISKVMLSVDVTLDVIQEAVSSGAQLLLAHHPLFFRGVTELGSETTKGSIVEAAIVNRLAVFSAHTNADIAQVGTANALANLIGIEQTEVLDQESGHGLVGTLATPESLIGFATRLAKLLPSVAAGLKVSGNPDTVVARVGLAPGAGDSFLDVALRRELDVFITSDLRHHPALDFSSAVISGRKVALIDISHYAAESIWLSMAQKELTAMHPDVNFIVSELSTDPWDFAVMQ